MNESEAKVINLIKNSTDPIAALEVALKLILEFLETPQAYSCTPLEPLGVAT